MIADKPLDAAWVMAWVRCAADALAEHAEELTAMDSAVGDGNHAANLERGLRACVNTFDTAVMEGREPSTPGAALKTLATTLLATVGGASGPLLAAAFLRASRCVTTPVLSADGVARLLEEASTGVAVRGRAERGDKTMLDTLIPGTEAFEKAQAGE